MYKMLIVDDEYYSREGIKKIIGWSGYEIEIIGSAENGIQGMEMVKELHPDIVLTDIRMKAMDGLSMIEELKKNNADCKFIIMSGYKVFEYAKKALEEGIDFYLLKPVRKDLLIDAVQKIKLSLDKSKNDYAAQKLEQSEYFIRNLLSSENAKNYFYKEKNGLDVKNYFVVMFRLNRPLINYQQDKINICKILFQQEKNASICFFNDYEFMIIYYNEESVDTAVRRMIFALESKLDMKMYAGIGGQFTSLQNLPDAKQQAYLALQYKFYDHEDRGIIHYEDIKHNIHKIDNEFVEMNSKVVHSVEICSRCTLCSEIEKAYEKIIAVKYIPQDICNWFKHLYMNILNIMNQLGFSDDEILDTSYRKMMNIDASADLKLWDVIKSTEDFCLHCIQILEENRQGSVSKNIKDIIRYIDGHYMEDISLEQLAKIFYTEFNYLSKLFKKETGKSYMQYLTEKRIKKAKELMRNPSLTIYEISDRVSYTDAKYFSQLFKKIEGVTPTEYRSSILKQLNK